MSKFDFCLTDQDIEITRQLMMHVGNREYFSADNCREAGITDAFADPVHMVGAFFAKLTANGVIEAVGEIPSEHESNNRRRVDLWRFNWERWRVIVHSRIEAYL
jgi:hypothetical protein